MRRGITQRSSMLCESSSQTAVLNNRKGHLSFSAKVLLAKLSFCDTYFSFLFYSPVFISRWKRGAADLILISATLNSYTLTWIVQACLILRHYARLALISIWIAEPQRIAGPRSEGRQWQNQF